jgi:hypothetical protein
MDRALIEKTEDFIKYSMNDSEILLQIYDRKIESFNNVLALFNITDPNVIFNRTNTPTTIGSSVYKLFQKYLTCKEIFHLIKT